MFSFYQFSKKKRYLFVFPRFVHNVVLYGTDMNRSIHRYAPIPRSFALRNLTINTPVWYYNVITAF